MSNDEIWAMILDVVKAIDYDLYKSLVPELCEDEEGLEQEKEMLIRVARKYLRD